MKLRLTVLYSVILALMLAGFGAALYATMEQSTLSALEDALMEQAHLAGGPPPGLNGGAGPPIVVMQQGRAGLSVSGGSPAAGPQPSTGAPTVAGVPASTGIQGAASALPPPGAPPPDGPDRLQPPPSPFGAPTIYFQARSSDGTVVAQSDSLRSASITLPLGDAEFARVLAGEPTTEVVSVGGGRLLVRSEQMRPRGDGRPFGVIQVGRSLAELDASLATLRTLLIVGSALALVVAFAAGWWLAGFGLRPIQRITRTAAAIGREHDFARRVNYDGPNDEIGRLARTFNTMLEELQGAHESVAHALDVQRRFVADASHELRTPLTTIRGNLRLLGLDPPLLPEDRAAVLSDLVDETERLTRLVRDLLALARADAGRPVQRLRIPVAPLLGDIRRQAALLGPGRRIEGAEPPSDLAVLGDPDALKQVLLVLADNAVKFTPTGGTVDIHAAERGADVELVVADTGPGIARDDQQHIFERFFRGDPARTGAGGAGLGLSIAKALAEAQGGTLHVVSEPGRGAAFAVRLPRAVPGPDAPAGATVPPASAGATASRPR